MLSSKEIKAKATEFGFDLCGITSAEEAPHADFYRRWISEAKHGEMSWMARDPDRRTQPRHVLTNARSIIVLGMNYYQPQSRSRGRIARYALGEDYHFVFQEKLENFQQWLSEQKSDECHRFYVDTGPVLEKTLAERSGIGWQGKSTMLINLKYGTWILLSEILTTLELEIDKPARDRCGSCTRCITACPTQAITAPYQLDARRCIAYLTIELKGSIPVEMRSLIGDRIYGCDECLDVCPWNRFAQTTAQIRFHGLADWNLHELLKLTEVEFKQRFKKSPILRIKRRGLARNICVVLGNIGDEKDLSALYEASQDPEPLVREHALWAIQQIEGKKGAEKN